MKEEDYLGRTQAWIERFVIGLNLCPFAVVPIREAKVLYKLSVAETPKALMQDFLKTLSKLLEVEAEELETAFVIHPHVLMDFDAYLDFAAEAEAVLRQAEVEGIVQVATFHPDYCFAGEAPDDPSNYTNRSPYPMLHLLREDSLEAALENYPEPEEIPERNIAKLREMGLEKVKRVAFGG